MAEFSMGQRMAEYCQEDTSNNRSSQGTLKKAISGRICTIIKEGSTHPSLITEYPAKHTATIAKIRSFGDDSSRHWIVASDSYSKQQAETENPPHLLHTR